MIEENGLLGERASIVRIERKGTKDNSDRSRLVKSLCSKEYLLIYIMSFLSLNSGAFAISNFKTFAEVLRGSENTND